MTNPAALLNIFVPFGKISPGYPGYTVPKARPKVTRYGTFMPQTYTDWRESAEGWLFSHKAVPKVPYTDVTVCILFCGSVRTSADLDNLAGSWLDAMVSIGILSNDSVIHVPFLYCRHILVENKEDQGTRIMILPNHTMPCPFAGDDMPAIAAPVVKKPKAEKKVKAEAKVKKAKVKAAKVPAKTRTKKAAKVPVIV